VDAYVPVEKPKYPESVLGVAKFEKDYAAVEKKQDRYHSSMRELMSKLLLATEEDIAVQVSQHEMFDEAKRRKDILRIWKIMRECAIGQGEHSPYVYVTKLINLRQDEDIAGYTKRPSRRYRKINRREEAVRTDIQCIVCSRHQSIAVKRSDREDLWK
jgi:hypothetical protein